MRKYIRKILSKDQYKRLEKEVLNKLENQCFVPCYFSKKESFDNLTIITTKNLREITDILKPLEIFTNEKFTNITYPFEDIHFQINLIKTEFMNYHHCCFFNSYDNIGKILNVIFKRWGFCLEEDGLFYDNYYDSDTIISKEKISSSPIEVVSLLGIDYEFYYNYFRNGGECNVDIETLFNYITSSCLFDPSYFVSNYKESSYNKFIEEYIPKKYNIEKISGKEEESLKVKLFQETVLEKRNLLTKVTKDKLKYEQESKMKDLFNIKILEKVTKVKGKELYDLMKYTRLMSSFLGKDTILGKTEDEIIDEVKRLHKNYEASQFEVL